jgi:hypothetical protein
MQYRGSRADGLAGVPHFESQVTSSNEERDNDGFRCEKGADRGRVQRYFDQMYDCDVYKFDQVFTSTSQLHGFHEGKMTRWTASEYEAVLAKRESPKSIGASRDEGSLLLDVASDT